MKQPYFQSAIEVLQGHLQDLKVNQPEGWFLEQWTILDAIIELQIQRDRRNEENETSQGNSIS